MEVRILEETNPLFVSKRRRTMIAYALRTFINGIQYSMILPSLWIYLSQFGASAWFYGVTLAIYEVVAVLTIPFVGRLFDLTKRSKEITYVFNTFDFIGSVLYALSYSKWLVIFGRVISGVGEGHRPVCDGEIAWIYKPADRIKAFTYFEIGRLVGVSLGPVLGSAFSFIHIAVGKWKINFATSPGIVTAVLWSIMQIVTFFMIDNVALEFFDKRVANKENKTDYRPDAPLDTSPMIQDTKQACSEETAEGKGDNCPTPWWASLLEALDIAVLTIVLGTFVAITTCKAFTSFSFVVLRDSFGWRPVHLSLYVLASAIEVLALLIIVGKCGEKIGDVVLHFFAMASLLIGDILMMIFSFTMGRTVKEVLLCGATLTLTSAMVLSAVSSKTLVSKTVSLQSHGLVQSFALIARRVALMVGPLVGSIGVYALKQLSTSMLAIGFLTLLALLCAVRRIRLLKKDMSGSAESY